MREEVELVPTTFVKVSRSRAYTCVVLEAEEKPFAIYTEPSHGRVVQSYLSKTARERPNTYDLIHHIFLGLDVKMKQVVVYDLQGTTYFARLFLEQQSGDMVHITEVDARPSDCITLLLLHKVPIYCTREVVEKTIRYEE